MWSWTLVWGDTSAHTAAASDLCLFKNTHTENTPSKNTQVLPESINLDNWVIGTLNQLLIRGSYNQTKFSKNETVGGKNLYDRPISYSPFNLS